MGGERERFGKVYNNVMNCLAYFCIYGACI